MYHIKIQHMLFTRIQKECIHLAGALIIYIYLFLIYLNKFIKLRLD